MCDFIVCPEDGKVYSYQDFVQKIYLESVPEEEKRAFENMSAIKEEAWNQETAPFIQTNERIDLYSEKLARKHKHEKKRTRNGYTVGNYKRKPERKDKRRKAFAEKKEQDKYTGDRLLDRRPGWNYDTVKDMSAKEAEVEARKNADNDLNRYQMNCNGAYYNGLIRERDLKEGKINDLNDIISGYNSDAQEMLKNMDELAEQINALQEKYNNIASHYAHIHECRVHAEKSLDYNKILFNMYDNIIKNLVLGIED